MRMILALASITILAILGLAQAETTPSAISADPPVDKVHPARLYAFALPTGGLMINASLLVPAGAGPHPTVLLLHGFPGNEQNLDLAQAIRRDGWNVLTLHYRGSWGSPGAFTFAHVQEDAAAALIWLRDPTTKVASEIDPHRLVVIGHSMGGWAAAFTGARDPGLLGTGLISAANLSMLDGLPRSKAVGVLDDNMGSSTGMHTLLATPDGLADEIVRNGKAFDFTALNGNLPKHPLLLVTSDDGLAGGSAALAVSLAAKGDRSITQVHLATDHSYSDRRIALVTAVLRWLESLPGAPKPLR